MRVYLTAPLFTQAERVWNRRFAETLADARPETTVVLPQDFRTEGKFNDPEGYERLFRRCRIELERSDAVVAVLEGVAVDCGVAFEMGLAYSWRKPIIGVRTDPRPGADHGVNLMLAEACEIVVREYSFQEDIHLVCEHVARCLARLAPPGQSGAAPRGHAPRDGAP